MIAGQILGAFPRGDHAKAAGLGPVHHLAHQRRLVAISQRIDQARLARALGEQRADQYVGFDGDVHRVLAVLERAQDVPRGRRRVAGDVDQHFDVGVDQGKGVVGHGGLAGR